MIDTFFDEQVGIVEGASTIIEIEKSLDSVRQHFNASHVSYIWRNQRKKLKSIYSSELENSEGLFSNPAYLIKLFLNDKRNCRKSPMTVGFSQNSESWIPKEHTKSKFIEGVHNHTVHVYGFDRGASAFTLSEICSEEKWPDSQKSKKMLLTLYARAIAESVCRISLANSCPAAYRLSVRETDVLANLARGLSRSETAHLLQISEHTIRVHVENAKKKLGALNTVHAVASAVANGFIPRPDH